MLKKKRRDLLAPLSKKEIAKKLAKRKFENFEVIDIIEKFFKKKRGYVFQMPKPGAPVILLLSGGLDSIIAWAVLMQKYKLVVYPFVLVSGKINTFDASIAAVKYYSDLYKRRFPKYFRQPRFYNNFVLGNQLHHRIKSLKKISSAYFFKNIRSDEAVYIEVAGLMSGYIFAACDYSELLFAKSGIRITTFFSGIAYSDGFTVKTQTLTSIRAAMLHLCVNKQDYLFQFTALPIEKSIGMFHEKPKFIKWANNNGIPLEKTHSCPNSNFIHCGSENCIACQGRKFMFQKAGVLDKTFYLADFKQRRKIAVYTLLTKLKNSILMGSGKGRAKSHEKI